MASAAVAANWGPDEPVARQSPELLALEQLRADLAALKAKVEADSGPVSIDRRVVDIDRIRFSPRVMVGVIMTVVGIAGGMYASTYGLRSDVRDILTTMASQQELEKANQRLVEERAANLRDSITEMKKRVELLEFETRDLSKTILKGAK